MFQQMKKRIKNEKGLTLIELLAVIVILAIVAAIAIPAIGNIIDNSRYNAIKSDAINVLNAANIYYTDSNSKEQVTVEKLIEEKYLDTAGKIPKSATITAASPRKLTAAGIEYSGSKTVSFNNVSITDINADNQKGSKDGNRDIGAASDNTEPENKEKE